MTLRVGVVGGGSFGRGIAAAAARNGARVLLWSRRAGDAPGAAREPFARTTDLGALVDTDLVYVAVPSPHVHEVAVGLGRVLDGRHLLVHVSRGLLGDALRPITHLLRAETPVARLGVLAGPLVADALAAGTPGGAIVGTLFPEVADAVRESLAGQSLRVYQTEDVVGVEVASAMVGMLALALGFAAGIGVGPSALGTMATRGIVESNRIAATLGASERTMFGLAGFGDLAAALAGDDRPETRLGRALAAGKPLAEAAREAGAYIEGVTIARRVTAHGARVGVDTPIARATAAVVDGALATAEALVALIARASRRE
jgi:glycerol-3-phosphate dehydrogenase (NAD(P)+)